MARRPGSMGCYVLRANLYSRAGAEGTWGFDRAEMHNRGGERHWGRVFALFDPKLRGRG